MHSSKHHKLRKKFEAEYQGCILGPLKESLGPVLTELVLTSFNPLEVPMLFVTCAGLPTLSKRKAVSNTLAYWITGKRSTRGGEFDGGDVLAPRTVMFYLRTLMGHMKDTYGWEFNLDRDFNFQGGLTPVLNAIFSENRARLGTRYGSQSRVAVLKGVSTSKDLDMSVFDESDPIQHIEKMITGFGKDFGFRGSKEHVNLKKNDLERGAFEPGHPYAGEEYWGLKATERKTDKITTRNPALKQNDAMRIPVKSEFGLCIERYLYKLHPFQERMYCRPATTTQMAHWKTLNLDGVCYSPNQPLGINKIREYSKMALTRLGFPGATAHSFRRLFITSLANDAGVSIEESMQSAGHNSVAAQRPYVVRNGKSEAAKFKALGM